MKIKMKMMTGRWMRQAAGRMPWQQQQQACLSWAEDKAILQGVCSGWLNLPYGSANAGLGRTKATASTLIGTRPQTQEQTSRIETTIHSQTESTSKKIDFSDFKMAFKSRSWSELLRAWMVGRHVACLSV